MFEAFRALTASGLGVIDVGARDGTHPALQEIAPLVELVGFEPDAEECAQLNAAPAPSGFRSVTYLPHALGAGDAEDTLHLCRSGGASSLLAPYRPFLDRFPGADRFDVVTTCTVETKALDDIRSQETDPLPAYVGLIKVDTQGTELGILTGARGTLAEVSAVEVEVEFAPLYKSQPLFRDVDRFMAELGFSLFKLRRMQWVRDVAGVLPSRSAGQLVFGDALYLRDPLAGGGTARLDDPRQAEALVLLACLYDCHDFALELIGEPAIAGSVDAVGIKRYIKRRSRRSRLGGLWKRRADRLSFFSWLRGYSSNWSRGDLDFYSRV